MPRPRKSIPPETERRIYELAIEGILSPSQIHRDIGGIVDLRTVQRRCKEYAVPDDSGLWSLADSNVEDAPLILEVFGVVAMRTAGRARITKNLAEWIVKVRRAAPSLPPYDAYVIAREYRRSTAKNDLKHIRALDALLAFRPWESEEAAQKYEVLLEAGIFAQPIYIGKWWRHILEKNRPMSPDEIAQNIQNFAGVEKWISEHKAKKGATDER